MELGEKFWINVCARGYMSSDLKESNLIPFLKLWILFSDVPIPRCCAYTEVLCLYRGVVPALWWCAFQRSCAYTEVLYLYRGVVPILKSCAYTEVIFLYGGDVPTQRCCFYTGDVTVLSCAYIEVCCFGCSRTWMRLWVLRKIPRSFWTKVCWKWTKTWWNSGRRQLR